MCYSAEKDAGFLIEGRGHGQDVVRGLRFGDGVYYFIIGNSQQTAAKFSLTLVLAVFLT